MVDKRIIEQVLSEQREEWASMDKISLCSRKEESLVDLESNLAQVVIGVRRSGKSTLCYNVLKPYRDQLAYVNFDDERFQELTSEDLNTVLEVLYKTYGDFKYLFLDEHHHHVQCYTQQQHSACLWNNVPFTCIPTTSWQQG